MALAGKSVKELRSICKENGIIGYSNKARDDLIWMIDSNYRQVNNLPRRLMHCDCEEMTVSQLKEICRERGIKGFTKKSKKYLVDLVYYGAH